MCHSKLDNWNEKVQIKVKVEILEVDEVECVFENEIEMILLEIIVEKLEAVLKALLKKVNQSKKLLSHLDEYKLRKKYFADLVFSENLNESEKSNIRTKIVSFL